MTQEKITIKLRVYLKEHHVFDNGTKMLVSNGKGKYLIDKPKEDEKSKV